VRPGVAGDGGNGVLDRLGGMAQGAQGGQSGAVVALFGLLHEKTQMDDLSGDAAAALSGEISSELLAHLALMARCKVLVDARGENVYMPRLDRMAFPILLLQGSRNACFDPSGTERSLAKLSARNGARLYERHLLADYGHNDCLIGKNALRDVYPALAAHLDRFPSS
jgi:cholesterol oxidase